LRNRSSLAWNWHCIALCALGLFAPSSAAATTVHGRVLVEQAGEPNVAVILDGEGATPAERSLDEVWLTFLPKVQVVPLGSRLRLGNHDDESHTVHGFLGRRTLFNLATVPHGEEQRVVLDRLGVVTLVCDVHSYMRAWVLVTRSPYAAVSDRAGAFAIDGVPPGRYRVRAWQPHDPASADEEPGAAVDELEVGAVAAPLELHLPRAPRDPEEAPRFVPPAVERHARRPTWASPRATWPSGAPAVLVASALAIIAGILGAVGNLRLAARRGWSKAVAVLIGCGLAFVAGTLVALGLHGSVATALGFGLFIGTVIFAAAER
jgi:hypothetical protein